MLFNWVSNDVGDERVSGNEPNRVISIDATLFALRLTSHALKCKESNSVSDIASIAQGCGRSFVRSFVVCCRSIPQSMYSVFLYEQGFDEETKKYTYNWRLAL